MAMWDYSATAAFPYGDDTTYRAMQRLLDCDTVEDWGCGTGWAKRFRKGTYIGVDGAPGYADVVADLRTYRSSVDGIFMRHVLEHNHDWAPILDNAVASARRRLVLILFTPMEKTTRVRSEVGGIPDISFAARDIESHFKGPFTLEDVTSATQYGVERIYEVDQP